MHPLVGFGDCSALILCGGQGSRMGGRDKGLIEWQGRPMVSWLSRLVRPLTDELLISCNRNVERYAPFADRLLRDEHADFSGPLAGIREGLRGMRHGWLLVVPCDLPNLDRTLLDSLWQKAQASSGRPAMLRQGLHWQPLVSLLPRTALPLLEQAWSDGERSPRELLLRLDAVGLDCAGDDPRLLNINTPHLLHQSPVALPSQGRRLPVRELTC